MKPYSTAQRLQQLMATRKLRQVDILTAAGPFCRKYNVKLEKNALSQYISGKVEPRQDKLTVLGLALDVSEAWLMGYEVPMHRNISSVEELDNYRIKEFIGLFDLLSNDEQDVILRSIKGILYTK